jgi:hypothetical protein
MQPITSRTKYSMTLSRDPLWKLLPGLLIYNLIGRHVLWWQAQWQRAAEGRDPLCGKPGWIALTDITAFPVPAEP